MCRNMLGSMPPPRPHNYLIYKAIFVFSLALLVASSAYAFGGGGGKSRKSSVYRGTGVDSINVYVGGQKKKNCPAHSSEQNGECVCDTGYQMFDDACKPAYRATCRREGMVWCEEFKACVEKEEDCEGLCPSERSCGSTCCSEGSTCSDGECCLETENAALCCPSGEKAYVHFWNGDKDESELACCNGTPYKAWGSDEFGWYEQRCCTDGTIFCAARDNSGKCLSEGCCTDSVVDGLGANGADLCCAGGRFDCTSQDRDGNCLEGACSYDRNGDEGDSYCKTDKDCDAYTQICENGQCINRCPTGSYMSGTGYCVPISHGCVSNADCDESEYCDITSSLFRCTAPDTGECKPIEYRYNVCEGDNQYESQINDRTMRVSNNTMSWWSADNWCKAQGLRLISLGDLGLQKPATKGCFKESCGISNEQWDRLNNELGCASDAWGENANFWVTESYDACRAYYVQPGFWRIHPYNRYGDGLFHAVCTGAVCPEGEYRQPDGSCAEECGANMAISGGNCVCAETFVMENGACVCPEGTSLVNGRCECPEGQTWTGEVCCPNERLAGTMCCEEGSIANELEGQPICCPENEIAYISEHYSDGSVELSCCDGTPVRSEGSISQNQYRQQCCPTDKIPTDLENYTTCCEEGGIPYLAIKSEDYIVTSCCNGHVLEYVTGDDLCTLGECKITRGQCITGDCSSNIDCESVSGCENGSCYCNIDFSQRVGSCKPIGNFKDAQNTIEGIGKPRRSEASMSWFSANNWCKAQGMHLITVEELQCYRSGTNSILNYSGACCAGNGASCSVNTNWYTEENRNNYSAVLYAICNEFGYNYSWVGSHVGSNGAADIWGERGTIGGLLFYTEKNALCVAD